MVNSLENDRRVRRRFQFWSFHYATASPIPYSAMLLRDALTDAVSRIDPGGQDPALRQMVVVGHSQGGLLAKLTVVDTGNRLWDTISREPIDRVDVRPETRDLLKRALFVQPLPFVRVVVFLATPHRGSFVTTRFLVHTISRFVRLPANVIGAMGDLIEGNDDALLLDPRGPRFGSVYNMRPGSPLLGALAETPVVPGVSAHSIIAARGTGRRARRQRRRGDRREPAAGRCDVGAGDPVRRPLDPAPSAGHPGGAPHPPGACGGDVPDGRHRVRHTEDRTAAARAGRRRPSRPSGADQRAKANARRFTPLMIRLMPTSSATMRTESCGQPEKIRKASRSVTMPSKSHHPQPGQRAKLERPNSVNAPFTRNIQASISATASRPDPGSSACTCP